MLKLLGRNKKFLLKSLRTLPHIHTESTIMLAFHKKEKNLGELTNLENTP